MGDCRPDSLRTRIVVADDDEALRRLVTRTLESAGHEVIAVPDGGRLLVFIARCCKGEEIAPDLIVSDVSMPVMTGLGMLKGVRVAHWTIPIILMTGYPSLELLSQAEMLRAGVLMKPFTASDLLELTVSQLESVPVSERSPPSRR